MNFAQNNGYDPVSLAIAWVASHPSVTAPLIGARNTQQLKPALAAAELSISTELRTRLSSMSRAPALATDREEERETPKV